MASAWCMYCDSWKGRRCGYGENILWSGQVVTLPTLSGSPGTSRRFRWTPNQAAASCARCATCIAHNTISVVPNEGAVGHSRHFLWKTFFESHTRWRGNCHQKKNFRSPNFRHEESGEALWLSNCDKPAWVDAQPVIRGMRTDHIAPAASLSRAHADQLVGSGFVNRLTPEFVKKLCEQGQLKGAVEVLEVLVRTCGLDKYLLYFVLKECVAKKNLMLGCQVHALAVKMGFGSDMFLCNHLIRMYADHGKLPEAMDVFRGVALPDCFMWASIISACAKQGQAKRAIELYQDMRATMMKPDNYVFVAALQACAAAGDLQFGKQLHSQIRERRLESDLAVGGSLVNMYAKCGSLADAKTTFEGLREKNVVTWTAMIAGYARVEGMGQDALSLYSAMHNEGIVIPDAVTFVCLLQACANVGVAALKVGKQLHLQIGHRGLLSDIAVGGSLVNMYVKCGSLRDARTVFDGLPAKNVVTWSAMIAGYAKLEGMGQDALILYNAMHKEGMAVPNVVTFVCLLRACANVGVSALEKGKQLHSQLEERGLESHMVVGGSLVNMYANCGSLTDARTVFDRLREKNVVAWNAMIAGYAKVEGMGLYAISLYSTMCNEGMVIPNVVTFVCLLQACANVGVSALEKGKQFHSQIKERGLVSHVVVGGSLVNMYVKCGSLTDAWIVFDGLPEKNVVTWTAMIAGYARQEAMGQDALRLYSVMHNDGIAVPDAVTFVCLLQACANVGVSAVEKGKQLHSQINERGLQSDMVVGGSLVNMYAKCGRLRDARIVFDGLREKNVVTWNAMVSGYAQQEGMGQEALTLHRAMQNEGIAVPDSVTYVCLLQACANMGASALKKGKQLHSELNERGLESEMVVGCSLVKMYTMCGSLTDARIVFDRLKEKDVAIWTVMIAGYARVEGMGKDALSLYSAMHNEGLAIPNAVTFVCLLQACANVGVSALGKGKQLYAQIKERRLDSDVVVGGSLVNMYARCGSLTDARIVFDGLREKDVVTWTAMIAGYAQQEGMGQEALILYSAMVNEGVANPDAVTFVCLLQACTNAGVSALEKGKQLHSQLIERELETDMVVGGCLVNMYAKCGSLTDARIVFDGLREKNVVTWNAMISGYAQQEGMGQRALDLHNVMRNDMITPDAVTYICLLQACASVGALRQGKELHSEIRNAGLESNALIGTSLVMMYAQCGRLEVSRRIFDRLPIKSVETWSALIKGYAQHGEGGMAIQSFEELLQLGIQPDEVTYVCLLTACSHAGMVDEGQRYFETMEERHGVKPDEWHYTCMVDLLGRSGHLERAEQMLRASGLADNVVSWTALLSACKCYGDADTGGRCFDHLVNLQPTVATAYVLLGCIYACAGRWGEVEKVELRRKAARARKKAAKACIEVREEVHEFTVGEDRSDVAATLKKMNRRVKEGGHVAQTQLILRAVSEQEKEDALCGHAEKLALAYGLLNTPAGSPLLVTKNLRMCNDCHSSTKIMSRVEKRDIVVRDGHKVHRFQNGVCTCQDRP